VSWSLVQDWSVLNTFSWAGSATAGAYTVEVRTRTSPWVLSDMTRQLAYTVP
jgi:hypothetical protein